MADWWARGLGLAALVVAWLAWRRPDEWVDDPPDPVRCPVCFEDADVVGLEWLCTSCGGAGQVGELTDG